MGARGRTVLVPCRASTLINSDYTSPFPRSCVIFCALACWAFGASCSRAQTRQLFVVFPPRSCVSSCVLAWLMLRACVLKLMNVVASPRSCTRSCRARVLDAWVLHARALARVLVDAGGSDQRGGRRGSGSEGMEGSPSKERLICSRHHARPVQVGEALSCVDRRHRPTEPPTDGRTAYRSRRAEP